MSVVNQKDVQNIVAAINACPDCEQLTAYATKQIELWAKQMTDTLKAKASANAKKSVPTSLDDCINWIKVHCEEAQAAYTAAMTEITEITVAFATISAAIASKASSMTCGTIPIPPLPTVPPTP